MGIMRIFVICERLNGQLGIQSVSTRKHKQKRNTRKKKTRFHRLVLYILLETCTKLQYVHRQGRNFALSEV